MVEWFSPMETTYCQRNFQKRLPSSGPTRRPSLRWKYQCLITRFSQRFQTYAWLQYDMLFHLKIASNPDMTWAVVNPELVATWLTADATKQKLVCHLSSDCPLNQQ